MNDRRPRIAIVNDQPRSSGTGTYAWHLAESLSASADHLFLDYRGGRVLRNPGSAGEQLMARVPRVPLIDNRPWFWRRCLRRSPPYDVVHFTSQNMSFLCGSVPGRSVVTCLDIIPVVAPEGLLERYWRSRLYSGLKRAGRIIAISRATKQDVMRRYGIADDKVDVVHLGVDDQYRPRARQEVRQALGLPRAARIVLHVGTAARRKRVPLLLEAFARARSCRDAVLVRIGRARPEHRGLARELGIEQRVRFLENVPGDRLPLYYSAADLFLFPSSCEGFGLPPLEAMASGCPVVAADNSSIPEVVGDAGVLVGPDDPAAWAGEIDRVLDDPGRAADLSRRGLARAAEFTWERTARMTEEQYRRLSSG
ncbi:glycosyltransferase family 1 protein [bacterium]|nr:glycosyltransferase family 1 protein [bacterium]